MLDSNRSSTASLARTGSAFCLAAKPLYAVQSTALWEPKNRDSICCLCFFVSHSRTERMIFHEVKGRCESVCTNVHTCRLRSRATQCRESSISARQKTRTNSIKADLYGLFCLFNFCVGLEPFEHRYARRTSSHFCLVAKPLHAVITTAPKRGKAKAPTEPTGKIWHRR